MCIRDSSIALGDYYHEDAARLEPHKIVTIPNCSPDPCPDYDTQIKPQQQARAEALGAERRMLESRTRRRNEVEEHVRRARRLALERRLRELAAEHEPVGARPSRVAFAAGSRSTTSDAATALEAERQRFEDTVASQLPKWRDERRAEQLASIAKLREQLAHAHAQLHGPQRTSHQDYHECSSPICFVRHVSARPII